MPSSARAIRWSSSTLRKPRGAAAIPPLDHLAALSDNVGVIQHAIENVPNRKTGYCTDDVARAFIAALSHAELVPGERAGLRLASIYLAFLAHAQLNDGRFHNFMDYDRRWLDEVGSEDSCGRAIWALGYGLANAPDEGWRRACSRMLDRALPSLDGFEYLRAAAYAALGLAQAFEATREQRYGEQLRAIGGRLKAAFDTTAGPGWEWFEEFLTYDNARLPEVMLRAAGALEEPQFAEIGLRALAFYEGITLEARIFVPIGNDGWYFRGGPRARYAQQPLEACAMVDAELAAFEYTSDASYRSSAELALEWYYGKNSRGIVMARGGGCYDGLQEDAVNTNMGAESTLAMLSAAYNYCRKRRSFIIKTGNGVTRAESR